MKNIRLTVQYDGTSYHGWQVQKNAVTVQQTLHDAIYKATGEHVHLIGCGRTDAGVHAKAYTANFFTNSTIPPERFMYALNAHLPDDIICSESFEVDAEFNAKKSAVKKTYSYFIHNSNVGDVFCRNYAWHYDKPLDIAAMKTAAAVFIGTHDFVGFASAGLTVSTTVRTIYSLNIEKTSDRIRIDVTGNGFLYNMVRIIVGTLVFVGGGKIDAHTMPDILASKDRARAGITAPPEGLILTEVYYK